MRFKASLHILTEFWIFSRGADMITRDMIITDVINKHPETLPVFKKFKLDCHECQIADLETLEHGAGVHKVGIDELLEALNNVIA